MNRLQPFHAFQSLHSQRKSPATAPTGNLPHSQPKPSLPTRLGQQLASLGQHLCNLFGEFSLGSQQPTVRWKRDRQGQSFYEVYDPQDQTTRCFETVTETRAWLETRYYR